MEQVAIPEQGSSFSPAMLAFLLIVVAAIAGVAYYFYTRGPTVPQPSHKSGFVGGRFERAMETLGFVGGVTDASGNTAAPKKQAAPKKPVPTQTPGVQVQLNLNTAQPPTQEGFFGGVARGSGVPDCLRSSAEGAELIGMFQGESLEDGPEDLRELTQIVSKLSCFKKDLVSPAHIVEATRYQQFVSSHDIEPIAEITGRCFAKVIPERDFEIAFDKWTVRGDMLIRRLCTAYGFTSGKYEKADKLFKALLRDVKDIARGACLQGEPMIASKPGPRDPHPYEDPSYVEFGSYNGYY
jgi:hypothetical protein